MAKGSLLLVEDLPREIAGRGSSVHQAPSPAETEPMPSGDPAALAQALFVWARSQPQFKVIAAVERELVRQALLETHGNQVQAARLLGITRATLRKRIEKHHLRREFSVE
jgi:DNA-binding NtrC family response regulator